jgi:3-oxoacyl-[acyl-carrier protein] reductase|tara:strand:+ start:13 stop:1191 length:1179 start_codon:yes stop_codon:yes gene_type:complete
MFEVGKKYTHKIRVTKKKIDLFKKITLDNNPIHSNFNEAKKYGLKKPIVFGMLTSSFLSGIIGNKIPGRGAIWSDCNITFSKPVYENDILNFESKIVRISLSTLQIILETNVFNKKSEKVMGAYSTVKFPKSFLKKIKIVRTKNIGKKKKKLKDLDIIIGASSDVGLEVAKNLTKKKKKLLLTYFKNKEFLKKEMKNKKSNFLLKLDLNSFNDLNKIKKFVKNKYSIKSIVYTISGEIEFRTLKDTNQNDIKREINIQTIGLFNLVKTLLEDLKSNECSIVVIGSDVVFGKPPIKMLTYNVAKNSLLGMTKSLAVELGSKGIRVNMVSPGIIQAKASSNFPPITREKYKVDTTLNKIATVKNISEIIEFLLSKKSSHITGVNLRANGGHSFD